MTEERSTPPRGAGPRRRAPARPILAFVAVFTLGCASACGGRGDAADGAGALVIAPGNEAAIAALFPPESFSSPVAGGRFLANVAIAGDRVRLHFAAPGGGAPVEVVLRPAGGAGADARRTRHFAVVVPPGSPAVAGTLADWVAETVAARERRSPWVPAASAPRRAGDEGPAPPRPGLSTEATAPVPWTERVYVRWILPSLWLALLLVGAAMIVRRRGAFRGSGPRRRVALALAGIVALGIVLRLALPPFGPGDIKNTLLGAYGGWPGGHGYDEVGRYGRAPEGLLAWLFLALPVDDRTVAGAFLFLSALWAPLLHALLRRLGYRRATCLTAALLVAVAPLAVRFGPTTSRYVPLVFLALAGWTLLLAWLDERRPLALVGATLALTLAAQCRPEALALPLFSVALVAARGLRPTPSSASGAGGSHAGWRGALPLAGAGAVHLGLLVVPSLPLVAVALGGGPEVAEYLPVDRPLFSASHNPFLSRAFTPLAWPVLALVGFAGGLAGARWRATLWLGFTGLGLAALLVGAPVENGQLLNARYHLTALPFLLALTAVGVTTLVDGEVRRRQGRPLPAWVRPVAGIATAALAALPMAGVVRDTTMNQEYRFLRDALPAVPDDCTIVYYYPDGDHGLRPQPGLSRSVGRRHRWLHVDEWRAAGGAAEGAARDVTPAPACAVFWRNAACAAAGDPVYDVETAVCDWLLARAGAPLAETTVPAAPVRAERYARDPIPVGLYELAPPAP